MSRIDDLLARQAATLAALQEAQVRAVYNALSDASLRVAADLEALRVTGGDRVQRFTAQHLRVMQAQLDAALRQLTTRLVDEQTAAGVGIGERAYKDLIATIRANEPGFTDTGNRIEWRTVTRLADERGLLLHRHSHERYGAELIGAIQRELVAGVARGLTIPQLTKRIVGADGVFARLRGRAELVARMEVSSAYNRMHEAVMQEAAAVTDIEGDPDPLMHQADEFFDNRNHPLSRAVHGVVAALSQPFRVRIADVQAAAAKLKRPAGGVLMRVEGAWYAGLYPMHFSERGRTIPYRASWDNGAALARMEGAQLIGIPKATITGAWREMAA